MDFRIADTFTDSLARLTAEEQKAAKTTAFDLQVNIAHPSLQLHKLDKARDQRFASVRVGRDIRLIVHKTPSSLLLCYVGHHDAAYDWAQRRKLEIHPATGAAQLVEIRETIEEIKVRKYVEVEQPAAPKPPLFPKVSEETLLGFGVPAEWLADVRVANEDTLFGLADHLPSEAAEALLEFATGGTPHAAIRKTEAADPFAHPDALRRFRTIADAAELERALDFPWDKWTVFLHPLQRSLVERDYGGPARVSGSAGTGKTVVAVHRAVHLARSNPEARVLLTTFSDALANALRTMLRRLIGNEPRLGERIEVHSMNAIGRRLYERLVAPPKLASRETIAQLLHSAAAATADNPFSERFVAAEWEQIVDAWQVRSWEAYRDVPRLGRKTRLPEKSRVVLWSIFEKVERDLRSRGLLTYSGLFTNLAEKIAQITHPVFDHVVVDESQDVSVAQLRFLAALGGRRPNALFFAGDIGQRIFAPPFSWKSLGVDVRGRSYTLRINYRTTHRIRAQSDRLLAPELADVDGIVEKRRGTTSTFNGPPPTILTAANAEEEASAARDWLVARANEGIVPGEIGVFVRSPAQFSRARAALELAGIPYVVLDERLATSSAAASLCTMHLAKGLEFRTVAVLACDDDVIPLRERIEAVGDEDDLNEAYASERHPLYVACTRARDHLLVSGVNPVSEFLDDLRT
ncbi:MAG: DEAD/DEAH box helicase [Candidatus Eremiobacteraeota bacterium]|nr:DEAD/DEAH box helicase [Candidatus Eremiobacteraeota bacterium]MBC5803617.1 DEAD/DEAH box helicase [Candidatus Eremiobacteraeota bacterium]MBC5821945.1 DEAD/DEAH box helicase [Candidatus Eremiobacteraeota bacterium]